MYNKLAKTQKQWCGYSDIIDYWLRMRQDLILTYSKVAGLLCDRNKECLPTEEHLNAFYASLIDYISAGHFKIYEMVMERWSTRGFSTNTEIDALYQGITETTSPLLSFNDKYSDIPLEEGQFITFDQDISRVGEIMELRFEQEDKLIKIIAESLANSQQKAQ